MAVETKASGPRDWRDTLTREKYIDLKRQGLTDAAVRRKLRIGKSNDLTQWKKRNGCEGIRRRPDGTVVGVEPEPGVGSGSELGVGSEPEPEPKVESETRPKPDSESAQEADTPAVAVLAALTVKEQAEIDPEKDFETAGEIIDAAEALWRDIACVGDILGFEWDGLDVLSHGVERMLKQYRKDCTAQLETLRSRAVI